ncbi:uncharacterized protein LTR77_009526 [Saxophila tyrrhenica]|uniref:Uncharacterized protein n=1 Tax=Saxophila tyrrhenica TaxID=1690608 RepID=A0AAV9P0Q7_9PEZI|nr:hypothetical protein LTR77_009526 [Saxophila tyrrhenica]
MAPLVPYSSTPPTSSFPQAKQRDVQYRKARPLPTTLLDSCTIWFEELLLSQAFALLTSALTSGTGTEVEAFIPPPQHLALAATLVVHSNLTTRTTSEDKHAAADEALRYLRHANSLLGPQEAGLDKAFKFSEGSTPTRGKRSRARVSDIGDELDDQPGLLNFSYTEKESLWSSAEDFWGVVGWAFNCSVAHAHRWARWKLWLELMIDVLQDDFENRLREAEKVWAATQSTAAIEETLRDSMLAQYLRPLGEGRNNKRRLMRAILADGRQKSLAEFGEVWKNETKPPKQKKDNRTAKRRRLDLENGEYGDYFDDSEDESFTSSVRRSRSGTAPATAQQNRAASGDDSEAEDVLSTASKATTSFTTTTLGAPSSLHLRQRLLSLLTMFSTKNPSAFLDTEDLFDLFTEFLRPLPLPIFQTFVLPAKPWLGPNSHASLCQMLLRPLLSTTAPAYNKNALTQSEFEAYYAPYAANSSGVGDNAKVGLLVEGLLRLLWGSGSLEVSPALKEAVEEGIAARREKAVWDGRKKVGGKVKADAEAVRVLACSADRMLAVLDMAR